MSFFRTICLNSCKGILAVGFFLIFTKACQSPVSNPPNIIFLMDDQHRWDALGYIGRTSEVPEEDHRDGWVFNQCMDFIEDGIDKDRPLFLYLSFLKPHAGHNIPGGYEGQYDLNYIPVTQQPPWEEDQSPHAAGLNRTEMYESFWKNADKQLWKEMKLRYWANCTWIDDMFGRTLRKLDEKGMLDNALIVYLSDHGEMLGERYYRFNKYCLYESSVRVPVILSGSALPDHLRNTIDHRPAGFSAIHQHPDQAAFMWRTCEYKLILVMKRKERTRDYRRSDIVDGELYNLSGDPMEWENIYTEQHARDIRDRMTEALLSHLAIL